MGDAPVRLAQLNQGGLWANFISISYCISVLYFISADLFSGLDSCSEQGIINYGVSMTTLEDVFLRLEEEAAADPEGKIHNPHPKTSAPQP